MIRDRGNIKWNAMMLPEHVKMLREWREKDRCEERPVLDEWALQDLNEQLIAACANHCEVELKIWQNRRIFKAAGKIAELDGKRRICTFEDGRAFPFESICGITVME
ncbi:YolD-like family protein [Ureibacillus sp. FSL K6-8385]|uniref:YolD-like family protein n=1 Tax=Ureibacillus terrenus TaxID=118246 RepID=A0A540V280_9BACL|nr:YolD-like family protein [Ureibacillus terrenus]MED3661299.1 YolD-like family protein [Ureibacillus terrenus]MED3764229.1 YolD-like family protein [Ureibacillus terrenus]TQE90821.1 YolD-like family protein [Ureibacillus terrenus]